MCKAIEEMLEQTRKEACLETAGRLLTTGKLSCEEIALVTRLTVEEVKSIDAPKTA